MKKNKYFIWQSVFECVPIHWWIWRRVIKSTIRAIYDVEGWEKCSYDCSYNEDWIPKACVVYENFLFESEEEAKNHDKKNHPIIN